MQQMTEGDIVAPSAGRVLTVPVTPRLGDHGRRARRPHRLRVSTILRLSLPERHADRDPRRATLSSIGSAGGCRPPATPQTAARQGRIAKVYPEIADGRVIADVEVADIGAYFVKERTLVWIPVGKRDTVLAVPRSRDLHAARHRLPSASPAARMSPSCWARPIDAATIASRC